MSIIGKFIANVRRKLFEWRVEGEIYHKIFPHLNGRANHGYPFDSMDEMVSQHIGGIMDANDALHAINRAAAKMPRAEGDAFRYITYRDLNERMRIYLQFAKRREYHKECDPRFVATHA